MSALPKPLATLLLGERARSSTRREVQSEPAEHVPGCSPRRASRVPVACLLGYLAIWIPLAIQPIDRAAWALENLLPLAVVPLAIATFRRFRFSDRAYVQGTIFLILHAIGSHYTYSLTPMGRWIAELSGADRNHYDRVVHFAFGLLMLAPAYEWFLRPPAWLPEVRRLGLAVGLIAAFSTAYELLEWLTAVIVEPSAGNAFLGTQGDVWDAQKDTMLACVGAVLAAVGDHASARRQRNQSCAGRD
jgi:putative membrane protein